MADGLHEMGEGHWLGRFICEARREVDRCRRSGTQGPRDDADLPGPTDGILECVGAGQKAPSLTTALVAKSDGQTRERSTHSSIVGLQKRTVRSGIGLLDGSLCGHHLETKPNRGPAARWSLRAVIGERTPGSHFEAHIGYLNSTASREGLLPAGDAWSMCVRRE
jgi:hypothetical protein